MEFKLFPRELADAVPIVISFRADEVSVVSVLDDFPIVEELSRT